MTGKILFGIDSLALGFQGTHPPDYYITLPTGYTKTNFAISGQTIDACYKNAATEIDAYYVSGQDNILVLWAGTNDIINGVAAPAIYQEYVDFVQHQRSKGWRVLVTTLPDFPPDANPAIKDAFNALLYAGWTYFADGLIDLAANATIGPAGSYLNKTYYQDLGVHFRDAGYQLIAGIQQTAINTLAAATPPEKKYIENTTQIWAAVTLSGTTAVVPIPLPPGDWELQGDVLFSPQPDVHGVWTSMSLCAAGLSLSPTDLPPAPDGGYNQWEGAQPSPVQPYYQGVATGLARFASSQPQTVYLVAAGAYSGQGVKVSGKVTARKIS